MDILLRDIEGTPFSYDERLDKSLRDIARKVQIIRSKGSLSPEALEKISEYFRIRSIYHSNAIEGNKLSIGETRRVIEEGLTISGQSLKDQAEARNLSHAIDFLHSVVSENRPIREFEIREIHNIILKGIDDLNAGRYREVDVEISGSEFPPTPVEKIKQEMADFARWLSRVTVSPERVSMMGIIYAAIAHTWFVQIHPFIDGNGRVARLLMNIVLMRYGFPIAIIMKEERQRYYDALEDSQAGDLSPFLSLMVDSIEDSVQEYESAIRNEIKLEEWVDNFALNFDGPDAFVRAQNEYEIWKSAMLLFKNTFQQIITRIDEATGTARFYFKEFDILDFDKYYRIRTSKHAKRTWFFRVDIRKGEEAARYLFFFGAPTGSMKKCCEVTLHISREEPAGSYHYEKLSNITSPNVPNLYEVGYHTPKEKYIKLLKTGRTKSEKMEDIIMKFLHDIRNNHFRE